MISHIDHFVLTVRSLEATCAFYERVLGFSRIDTPGQPTALAFGKQKINVHEAGHTFEPKAKAPTPGSGRFLPDHRPAACRNFATTSKPAASPSKSGRWRGKARRAP